jgi:hypothetical protein
MKQKTAQQDKDKQEKKEKQEKEAASVKVVTPVPSSDSKARNRAARSLNTRGQFINTLEPIHEQQLEGGVNEENAFVEEEEEGSPTKTKNEADVSEAKPPTTSTQSAQLFSPSKQSPSPARLPSSLLTSQMAHYEPQNEAKEETVAAVAKKGVGFADHSAANDIVSTSFHRNQLKQQSSSNTHSSSIHAHHGHVTSNMDSMYNNQINNNVQNMEASNKSGKTVSFSLTNQTIEADNTIRASSVSLAIHPAVGVGRDGLTNEETEFIEGSAMLPNTGRNKAAVLPPDSAVVAEANTVHNQHIPSSARPGLNANLHIEMSSLANSVNQATSRVMSVTGRQSVIPSIVGNQDINQNDDQQQELTEKAVVVIRRVRDKLTGLDFPDTSSGSVQALAVPEQVERLIKEATSNENLSQSFFGWCPYW